MNQIHAELREKTIGYITAALGLVAGLAWNDAIKSLIEHVFPAGTSTLVLKFFYAVVITVVVVIVGQQLLRFAQKKEDK